MIYYLSRVKLPHLFLNFVLRKLLASKAIYHENTYMYIYFFQIYTFLTALFYYFQIQSDIGIAMANGQLPTEFEHDRRKKVAIKCLELEGMLESQG